MHLHPPAPKTPYLGVHGTGSSSVVEIDSIVGGIAASAQEQASGIEEVSAAINKMDQITQQNAAMVEQSTAATHGLTREVDELARVVDQFQLGDAAETRRSGMPR